jgi:hypothetical protein
MPMEEAIATNLYVIKRCCERTPNIAQSYTFVLANSRDVDRLLEIGTEVCKG